MSARERVAGALELADRRGELGAFWALDRERALAEAERLDARGPAAAAALAGTPVAVKDLFDQAGLPTTAGLRGEAPIAARDAAAVRRLRAAGAIPIGKTAMDPLACTTGGQAPGFPPCLNPRDRELSPGGSSSGSAVAVAAGIVPVALASDTAGSARIPAAYCGIVGLKPARRAISRRGCVRVMPGFDTPGVVARSVGDAVAALAALTGRAPGRPPGRRPLRLALLADLLAEAAPEVASACEAAVEALGRRAARVAVRELGWRPRGLGVLLARELAETWGDRVEREPDRFTAVIRDTVAFGRRIDADRYASTRAALLRARAAMRRRFAELDAVVAPTTPTPAPPRESESVEVSTAFTRIFNALDWVAISVPLPRAAGEPPIGIQVAGRPSRLSAVLAAAAQIERRVGGR